MSSEYSYMPTDLEEELFLSEVPIELIEQSIQSQFNDPLEFRKTDYIQSFIMKYEFSKENLLEDDMIMLENYRDDFLRFIEKIFEEYLSVGFVDLDQLDDEDAFELIHLTYRFFMKNIKKNFVHICYNYIKDNAEELIAVCGKKKDVTASNFKSEIENETDVQLLANLHEIIEEILERLKRLDTVDEFFQLCIADEHELELEFVMHAYNNFELTGNFIEKYVSMINETFLMEIQSKMRNRILKKYPKRVRNVNTEEKYDDLLEEVPLDDESSEENEQANN